jgi:hypothetical protein
MVPVPRHFDQRLFDNPCFDRADISCNHRGTPRERANTGKAREKAYGQNIFQHAQQTSHSFIEKRNSDHAGCDCR